VNVPVRFIITVQCATVYEYVSRKAIDTRRYLTNGLFVKPSKSVMTTSSGYEHVPPSNNAQPITMAPT